MEDEGVKVRVRSRKERTLKKGYAMLILLALLALSLVFSFTQYRDKLETRRLLASSYMAGLNKASAHTANTSQMYDIVRLSRKPEQAAPIFAQIWNESSAAHETVSGLSYTNGTIASALSYLAKSKEVSYRLMEKTIAGKELTNEEWKEVEEMRAYGQSLSDQLSYTLSDINILERDIKDTLIARGNLFDDGGINKTSLLTSAGSLFGTMADPPITFAEIYEKQSVNRNLKFIANAKEITWEEGKKAVEKLLPGYEIERIDFVFETDITAENALPVYSYDVVLKGDNAPKISMDITQMGGYPVWMLNYTDIPAGDNFISMDKAIELSGKFLLRNNYQNMKAIDWENSGDYATIFFAPYTENTFYYTDIIRIKISLVNGAVIGFEASQYIDMHYDRAQREPKLLEAAAKELVSQQLDIKNVYMAVIPSSEETSGEVFCYEFRGTFNEADYSVFINADTGKQEKIAKIAVK